MPVFSTGAEEAEAAATGQFSGGRIKQHRFEDKKRYFFRVLSAKAEWLTAASHNFMPTKPAPADLKQGSKWPDMMWAICQNDKMFRLRDADGVIIEPPEFEAGYGACPIDTIYAGQKDRFQKDISKPVKLTYSLIVLVEAVKDGDQVQFRDLTETYEDGEGNKHTVPQIRYMAQKWTNVYSALVQGAFIDGEVRNKVWAGIRTGTDFSIQAVGVTADCAPGTPLFGVYEKAIELMDFDLAAMILSHAGHDHYNRFFVRAPGEAAPAAGPAGAPDEEAAAANSDVDQAAIDDWAAKLKNRVNAPGGEAAPTGTAPAEAAPATA